MTTAQRVRRRQRIQIALELVAILVLSAGTFYLSDMEDKRDKAQDECFKDALADIRNASQKGRKLLVQDFVDLRKSNRNQDNLIDRVFKSESSEESLSAFRQFKVNRDRLEDKLEERNKTRKANPIPDFPTGDCK